MPLKNMTIDQLRQKNDQTKARVREERRAAETKKETK